MEGCCCALAVLSALDLACGRGDLVPRALAIGISYRSHCAHDLFLGDAIVFSWLGTGDVQQWARADDFDEDSRRQYRDCVREWRKAQSEPSPMPKPENPHPAHLELPLAGRFHPFWEVPPFRRNAGRNPMGLRVSSPSSTSAFPFLLRFDPVLVAPRKLY